MSTHYTSSSTIKCTRRIEFDAAHRIPEHSAKCKLIHGHRYAVEATFQLLNNLKNHKGGYHSATNQTDNINVNNHLNNPSNGNLGTSSNDPNNAHHEIHLKNNKGMVIDFGIIKNILSQWINENWDHNIILSQSDQELGNAISKHTGQQVFFLDSYPTAENLALFLLHNLCPKIFDPIQHHVLCTKIKLWETPNSFVVAKLNNVKDLTL